MWDIETAPQEGFFWQAKTDYIPHSMQEEDTTILSTYRIVTGKHEIFQIILLT